MNARLYAPDGQALLRRGLVTMRTWPEVVGHRLALPGLRGLWNMIDSGEATVQDFSPMGRHLTINGNPTYITYQASGLPEVPALDFDGMGDYLSIADAAWNSITGAVTLLGWFRPDDATPAALGSIAGHHVVTGNQRSFRLANLTAGTLEATASVDGTAFITQASAASMSDGVWHHCAFRYIPSTELSVFLNGVETLNTTSIPASLHNSTGAFSLGGTGDGGQLISGHLALWSLHAAALTDEAIEAGFAQERGLFSV